MTVFQALMKHANVKSIWKSILCNKSFAKNSKKMQLSMLDPGMLSNP